MTRNYLELQQRFERQQAEQEPLQPAFVALVGDGSGSDPRVDDNPNYIVVRSAGRGVFPVTYNPEVPIRNDVPVYVGPTSLDPDRWEVKGIATQYLDGLGDFAYQPFHANSHIFRNEDGGDDVVWMQKQQGVYFLAAPTDPSTMKVFVHTDFYLFKSEWRWWPGGESPTFAGLLPAAGFAKYVLLVVDAETNVLEQVEGNEFPIFPPVNPAVHIPDLPSAKFPTVAVYLTNTTTELEWDNLFDVRLLVGGGADTTLPAPHPLLHPTTHDDTHTGTPPLEGDMIYGKEDRRWKNFPITAANEILYVAESGTYPEWGTFDWDRLSAPGGADMVHSHDTVAEGGQDVFNLNTLGLHQIDTEIIGNTINHGGFRRVYGQVFAADNLDTITTGTPGEVMVVGGETRVFPANPVTVRHAVGNIRLADGDDFLIDGPDKNIAVVYTSKSFGAGGYWMEVGRKTGSSLNDHRHSPAANDGGNLSISGTYTDGTAGSIPFLITGGFLQEDNPGLYFDPATDSLNVGKRIGVGLEGNAPATENHAAAVGADVRARWEVYTTGTHRTRFQIWKSQGGSYGVVAETLDGSELWVLGVAGVSFNNAFRNAFTCVITQDGAAGAQSVPGHASFSIGRTAVVPTEQLGLTIAGVVSNETGDPEFDTRMESDVNTHMFWLDSSEDKIEMGQTGSYTRIEPDGTVSFHGNATIWEDLRVPLVRGKIAGANVPTWSKFKDNGAGSNGVYGWSFDDDDEIWFDVQIPHSWKIGTPIYPHLHWSPSSDVDPSQMIGIGLEYTWADIDQDFSLTSIITRDVETGIDNDEKHLFHDFSLTGLTGTSHDISSILKCRFFRQAAATGNYSDPIWAHEIDFHYEIDTVGSRQITTK